MECVVGDAAGQLKLITVPFAVLADLRPHTVADITDGSRTKDVSVSRLLPPGNRLQRSAAVKCMCWHKTPAPNDVVSRALKNNRLQPSSDDVLFVGRKNGLVHSYSFPSVFKGPKNEAQSSPGVAMRSPIVLVKSLPSSVVLPLFKKYGKKMGGRDANPTVILVICENGDGAVFNWDKLSEVAAKLDTQKKDSDAWPYLGATELFPEISFKLSQGRLERADGARIRDIAKDDLAVNIEAVSDQELSGFLVKSFKLPGPIHAADLSSVSPNLLAFGGRDNCVKIFNLSTMKAEFSGKPKAPDQLGLQDIVSVKTIKFLDRFPHSKLLAVGTRFGKVQLYDWRYCRRPVFEFAPFPMGQSVKSLAVSEAVRAKKIPDDFEFLEGLQKDQKERSAEMERENKRRKLNGDVESSRTTGSEVDQGSRKVEEEALAKIPIVWESNAVPEFTDSRVTQFLVVGSNKGTVRCYTVHGRPREGFKEDGFKELGHKVSRSRHMYRRHYENDVTQVTLKGCPVIYNIRPIQSFRSPIGGIQCLAASALWPYSVIVGGGTDRYLHIWDRRVPKARKRIYLKNGLVSVLIGGTLPL